MKLLKDKIDVKKTNEKYVVKRVVEEEYEPEELSKIVKNMEDNLERLSKQIEQLNARKRELEKSLSYWKKHV